MSPDEASGGLAKEYQRTDEEFVSLVSRGLAEATKTPEFAKFILGRSADEHKTHHRFVEEMIEHHRRRNEMLRKIQESTLGWMVIAVISGIGMLVWKLVEFWKTHHG